LRELIPEVEIEEAGETRAFVNKAGVNLNKICASLEHRHSCLGVMDSADANEGDFWKLAPNVAKDLERFFVERRSRESASLVSPGCGCRDFVSIEGGICGNESGDFLLGNNFEEFVEGVGGKVRRNFEKKRSRILEMAGLAPEG
jgi:hypothetical protein